MCESLDAQLGTWQQQVITKKAGMVRSKREVMWRGPKTKKKTSSQNFRHTSQTPHTPPSMQANIPDRLNAVLVPEGIARVSYVADSKMTNTGTFTFRREDHTLGNLLRMYVSPFSL